MVYAKWTIRSTIVKNMPMIETLLACFTLNKAKLFAIKKQKYYNYITFLEKTRKLAKYVYFCNKIVYNKCNVIREKQKRN